MTHFTRTAHTHWTGGFKTGLGKVSSQSNCFKDIDMSFNRRFGSQTGSNPEELIAAAHSACFSMAFAYELEKMGKPARDIDVQAEVSVANVSGSWVINKAHLIVNANVPGMSEDSVRRAAEAAKTNCPVSKLLKAEITMDFNMSQSQAA